MSSMHDAALRMGSRVATGFNVWMLVTFVSGITLFGVFEQWFSSPQNTLAQQVASQRLVRISQVDPAQYTDQQQFSTWSPSTCSTASMTEVLNAFGHSYKISDVLAVEINQGAISASQGLLGNGGVARTLNAIDPSLRVTWGSGDLTLGQIIADANAGSPVIVGVRTPNDPNLFPNGHIMVIRGGDSTNVFLVDSSVLNETVVSQSTFLSWWEGFYAIVNGTVHLDGASSSGYSVVGLPTITADHINAILANAHSPAAGTGQSLYDLGVQYNIDPVFALAFFMEESSFGTAGVATITHSLGNMRCVPQYKCYVDPKNGGYASFDTWEQGYEAWYQMISGSGYVGAGLTTVEQIIPKYAPSADNNNEAQYIQNVEQAVDRWRSGSLSA